MLMNVCHVREGYGSGAMTVSTELSTPFPNSWTYGPEKTSTEAASSQAGETAWHGRELAARHGAGRVEEENQLL